MSLESAKRNLEHGINTQNITLIQNSITFYKDLYSKDLTKELKEHVLGGILRGLTALCSFDTKNSLVYLYDALKYNNTDPCIYNNLGFVHHKQYNNIDKAIEYYEKCLYYDPKYIHAYLGIIDIYDKIRQPDLRKKYIDMGLLHCKENADLLNIKALFVLQTDKDIPEAINLFSRALKTLKKFPDKNISTKVYLNLGHVYGEAGDYEVAVDFFIKSIKEDPTHNLAYQNILLNIHYFTSLNVLESKLSTFLKKNDNDTLETYIEKIHRVFTEKMYGKIDKVYENDFRDALHKNKRLKIAYVSADFIDHAVSYFSAAIFQLSTFENYIFSETLYNNEQLKSLNTENFIYTANMSDSDIKNIIKEKQIDIVIDLAGYTRGNRLGLFSLLKDNHKILSYIGYPNNIPFMKRISDKFTDDLNKNTINLNRFFMTYRCRFNHLEYKTQFNKNEIILGSFAKLPKINSEVVKTWKSILKKIPNSKLLLKSKYFTNPTIIKKWKQKFPNSILIVGPDTQEEHMNCYKLIDIQLDTWPYSGTTITCESLYMNIPVITLCLKAHVSRVSGSILHSIGLDNLITYNVDDYINKVIEIANSDLNSMNVRERFLNSELTDYNGFIKDYEDLLRKSLEVI